METYKIYCGGEFITTNQPLKVFSPFNNNQIATTYLAQPKDLNTAITKAEQVKETMKQLPSYKRYEILRYISDKIEAQKENLANILAKESAKPFRYALGEIERAKQTFLIAAEESKRLPKEYISLDWTPSGKNKEGIIKYFPIGLVAGIAPFNFPMNLAVHKIAPAIASGNPIILKPARSTPLSVLELAKIIDQTDLPKGAVSILPMDRDSGNQLVTDDRFKLLSFTGSPAVGWKMKQQAGRKKVLLELGGNAGVIVAQSADINLAVKRCLVGGFAYSGQVCIHVQRIYIQKNIFDEFVSKMIEETKKLKYGSPEDLETEISAMIDEDNAKRVESWVNDAVSDGAKILFGGKRNKAYYEPTIITNTQPMMNVCALEVFGPVVTVGKFNKIEDAFKEVNNSQYGLQAGIFTNSVKEVNWAFNALEVGGVIINDVPTFRVDHMPYGGIKNSGLGREGIKYAIYEMMEPKLLVKEVI
ncbi:MAG TPA: aldehyde dehydrogenase family protein [Bacteroidales bacterium]|nr:aldehyde dehydrogenase family protein [Bacteroidales bacterium]